jgi:hypothetical protein
MIRKPDTDWGRESGAVGFAHAARDVARGGVTLASRGGHAVRGLVCWAFAVLWGFAALGGGLIGGSLPTLIGVGAMAAGMAWLGARAFTRARGEEPPPLFARR